jgi:hypothetical protein
MKRTFGIYTVEDEYDKNGRWLGYRCAATASTGKQGKLYIKSDGTENYRSKPEAEDDDLEI